MNRRSFLQRAAVVPVAAVGLAVGVKTQQPDAPLTGLTLTLDLMRVLPPDGKWHDIGIQTRAMRAASAPQQTAYLDYVRMAANR